MDDTALVLIVALVAVLVYLGLSWISLVRATKPTNIPGPPTWPIIGNAGHFFGANDVESVLEAFIKLGQDHEAPLTRVWFGQKLMVFVKTPKYIEALVNHKAANSRDEFFYKPVKDLSAYGFFARNGEEVKRIRRQAISILLPKNINEFQQIICKQTNGLIRNIQVEVDKEAFNPSKFLFLNFLEILLEATMGWNNIETFFVGDTFETIQNIERELHEAIVNVYSWKRVLGLDKYNPKELHNSVKPSVLKCIDTRKKELELLGNNYLIEEPKNFVDLVLQTAEIERIKPQDLHLIPLDFLMAGSDTQSVTVTVLILLLAMHQEYQDKAYKEQLEIFGHSNREPEKDDLKNMVYLEMCIKEALRHCSPPTVGRTVDDDIEIDGYIIPKDTALAFAFFYTHKDPQYWERPEEFFPDHFLPEAVAKRPKGTFIPFMAGPRMCPGQLYSFHCMKTVLSLLLREYHFTTDQKYSELKYKYSLMREPVNPLVKISKRLR